MSRQEPCEHSCPFGRQVAAISEKLDGIKDQQDKIYRSIEGNGSPGIRQRLEFLEKEQAKEYGEKEEREKHDRRLSRQSWTAIIVAVISLCGAIAVELVK